MRSIRMRHACRSMVLPRRSPGGTHRRILACWQNRSTDDMSNFLTRWIGASLRERTLRRHAIDAALWHPTRPALPFSAHLDDNDRIRLRELTTLFIAQKQFSTAHDLELTDAMIVSIAVQASLPVLNLSLD